MPLLDSFDNIPGKLFPKLKPRMVNGFLFFPYKFYREVFHVIGSCLLIALSHILYVHVHVHVYAPIAVFVILGIWTTYQEFYLHAKKYNQKLPESILDWLSWIVPFIIYFIILY